MDAPVDLLRRVNDTLVQEQRSQGLAALEALVKSGEFRDWPLDRELYEQLFALLPAAFSWRGPEAKADVARACGVFLGVARTPEFDPASAESQVTPELLHCLASRVDGTSPREEWPWLRDLLLLLYARFPAARPRMRTVLGRALRSFGQFCHKGAPVGPLLQVLMPIIRGFESPLTPEHRSLLFDVLLPLHRPNDWLVWDRQAPLISMYHKELVRCILWIVQKQPGLAARCVEVICTHFPSAAEASTPKEVMLLHEIAEVLKLIEAPCFQQLLPLLVRHMVRLLGSHNAQPIEAVLQFWKDPVLAELFRGAAAGLVPPLLPVLLRGGEPFWNPTVNKMTALVLEKLEQSDPVIFASTAEDLWGPGRQVPAFEQAAAAPRERTAEEQAESDARMAAPRPAGGGSVSSLKFGMAGWRPPGATGPGGAEGRTLPPATTTGVAPWAFQSGGAAAARRGPLSQGTAVPPKQPPSTVTGVAPWAFGGGGGGRAQGPLASLAKGGSGGQGPTVTGSPMGVIGEDAAPAEERSGIDRVHEYMKLLSPGGTEGPQGDAHWEAALASETPTLLPALKFHQLVFGHEDLGAGAFSVVRYARLIEKTKTQKEWAEYAVKVINTKTMEELGYQASVNREICVLKMLSHPGIARLVSSFRFRDGAYLVLEYASKGDLHSILVRCGRLEEDTARFFLGEVIAALSAIHEIGFVYADLKPENVVITSTGHAKLTDFGGCRPVTEEARGRTRESLLRGLRNGDWRAADEAGGAAAPADSEEASPDVQQDERVEGTTLYLPPEVVQGRAPTLAADAWALGCLAYQLLTGRPPLWAASEREEDLLSRIVSFKLDSASAQAEGMSQRATSLADALLAADTSRRLSVQHAAVDPFFEGMDVFALHRRPRGPVLPAGERAAASTEEDARWQKRQFSKIWTVAASPQDYALPKAGEGDAGITEIKETSAERGSPFVEEALQAPPAPQKSRLESL